VIFVRVKKEDSMIHQEEGSPQGQRQKAASGENKSKVWSFLQRERVGSELLFTARCADKASEETGVPRAQVYGILTRFEKEGLIRRVNNKRGEGALIVFLPPKNKESQMQKETPTVKLSTNNISDSKKFSPTTTFGEALENLEIEILSVQAKIESLRIKKEDLEKTISEKRSLRDHLLVLIGKEND